MAADGNAQTCWQAADEDYAPYWMLDTEKLLTIKEIQIDGLQGEYVLEVSDDQKEWKTLKRIPNPGKEKLCPAGFFRFRNNRTLYPYLL